MAPYLNHRLKRFSTQRFRAALAASMIASAATLAGPLAAEAQTDPGPSRTATMSGLDSSKAKPRKPARAVSKPKPNPYGSPLDTLMSTHIYADVPAAQPFVRETRPDDKNLDYTPLNGADPERPKPRDPAGVAALQAELEAGGAKNEQRAKGLQPPAKVARKVRRAKPVAASE